MEGIRSIDLAYLDEKLAFMKVIYDASVKWESNLQFTAAVADQLHLPLQGWQGESPTRLPCEGFIVGTREANTLIVQRSDFGSETAKRRAALEQKKRVEFKP